MSSCLRRCRSGVQTAKNIFDACKIYFVVGDNKQASTRDDEALRRPIMKRIAPAVWLILILCYTVVTKSFASAFIAPSAILRTSSTSSSCLLLDDDDDVLVGERNIHKENHKDNNNCVQCGKNSKSDAIIVSNYHRRRFIILSSSSLMMMMMMGTSQSAKAGIDPSALKSLPIEGDISGSTTRLRQLSSLTNNNSATGARPDDSKDIAFTVLPSGEGSYRTYREGSGDATIQPGSKVAVEMTIRCRSFATTDEPGGVTYFTTKGDTDFNELAWTVGSSAEYGGAIVPTQLEECMMGMKRGSVRRIELPSPVVYAAYKAGRLPLPSEKNTDGKRRFEKLWKTDATLLFEVLVTRIK